MLRAHGHHEQVELRGQGVQAGITADAVHLVRALAQNADVFPWKTFRQNIVQNDPAEIPASGGNSDDAYLPWMQQRMDPAYGALVFALGGQGKPAHAVQRNHEKIRKGVGIDLHLLDDEFRIGIDRRVVASHLDERGKTFQKLLVGHDSAAGRESAPRVCGRRWSCGTGEKALPVGKLARGGHYGLPLSEPLGIQLRIRSPESGAHDHAEFAGIAQPHDKARCRTRLNPGA